jgi:hypothetical protein
VADDARLTSEREIAGTAFTGGRMITLGGYPFDGPIPLDEWGRNGRGPGIYAICHPASGDTGARWQALCVGELIDATWPGSPRSHSQAAWWVAVAGGWKLLGIAFHPMPMQASRHRQPTIRHLIEQLRPRCNTVDIDRSDPVA